MSTGTGTIEASAKDVLFNAVLPQALNTCLDPEYGGYLVDIDAWGRPNGPHRKTLEHAGRTALAFALLHRAMPDRGYDRYLDTGLRFLKESMWDTEHGGFFAIVDRSGKPLWDGLKHPHGVTYVVRAIALSGSVIGEERANTWAAECLNWMDSVSWNNEHGGYSGTFRRDGTPYEPGERLPTDYGDDPLGLPAGMLEMNTQGDAIHMLHDALVFGGVKEAESRLAELVDRVVATVQPNGILPFLMLADWTGTPTPTRTGHQFQLVRRLVNAGIALDRTDELAEPALRMTLHGLRRGRHPEGGFPLEMSSVGHMWSAMGSSADARQWWVQLEALDAFSLMAEHPNTPTNLVDDLRNARDSQWAYFQSHFVDRQFGGTFELATPPRDPQPAPSRLPGLPGLPAARVEQLRGQVLNRVARVAPVVKLRDPAAPAAPRSLIAKQHGWKDISHEVAVLLDLARLSPVTS